MTDDDPVYGVTDKQWALAEGRRIIASSFPMPPFTRQTLEREIAAALLEAKAFVAELAEDGGTIPDGPTYRQWAKEVRDGR